MVTDSEFEAAFSISQRYPSQLIHAILFSSPKNSSKKNPKLREKPQITGKKSVIPRASEIEPFNKVILALS
jgi:hypothetical protein